MRDPHHESAILHRVAQSGCAISQYTLGIKYFNGMFPCQKDDATAAEWLSKAAEQGFIRAQLGLWVLYTHGLGVPKDAGLAAWWYHKAEEQGVGITQFYLGLMYRYGDIVPRDGEQCAKRIRWAAEQGVVHAQIFLSQMYADGDYLPVDIVEACAWGWIALHSFKQSKASNYDWRELEDFFNYKQFNLHERSKLFGFECTHRSYQERMSQSQILKSCERADELYKTINR